MKSHSANTLYYDVDADISIIKNKNVGIIGYGNQGRAQALNLSDSGVNVMVGLRPVSKSRSQVAADELDCGDISEIVNWADVISMLIPDQEIAAVFDNLINQKLRSGQSLLFSHGYNIHYNVIQPPDFVDVIMVAPSGAGKLVREKFKSGSGVPNLIAVHQDVTGKAFQTALSYSRAIGGTKAGAFTSTFQEETETDLFGEQVVLCGGIPKLIKAAFDTLVESGYQPQVAWFVCYYEVKLIVDLFYEKGFEFMNQAISDTAEYGAYTAGSKLIDEAVKSKMKDILSHIQSGDFHQEWTQETKSGYMKLMEMRKQERDTLIEKTGRILLSELFE